MTLNSKFTISLFNHEDHKEVDILVSLINLCYRTTACWNNEAGLVTGVRIDNEQLQRDAKLLSIFVARDERGKIVGCVKTGIVTNVVVGALSIPSGYFGLLCVHPDVQSQGLGTHLIRYSEQFCIHKGVSQMVRPFFFPFLFSFS